MEIGGGSGKSFVLERFEKQISDIQCAETSDNKYLVFHYDCWKYDYYEEPSIAIISAMMDMAEQNTKLFSPETNAKINAAWKTAKNILGEIAGNFFKNKIGVDLVEVLESVNKNEELTLEEKMKFDDLFSFKKKLEDTRKQLRKLSEDKTIIIVVEEVKQYIVKWQGELRAQQDLAAQRLLIFDNGILSAATAFGKTVVCSYLIAQRKVSTLILLESTELIGQWEEELNRFLVVDEELPEYQTKTGRVKKRASVIGTLKGGRDTMTGIIGIAMIGSLYKKGGFHEKLNTYGMVIMDECHHAASATAQEILKKVNAKYVYGVSATPMRSDRLEKINDMLLGPVRHRYTSLERTKEQGIDHLVIPRYKRMCKNHMLFLI